MKERKKKGGKKTLAHLVAREFKAHQTIEGERPGTVRKADPRFYTDFPLKKSVLRQAPLLWETVEYACSTDELYAF